MDEETEAQRSKVTGPYQGLPCHSLLHHPLLPPGLIKIPQRSQKQNSRVLSASQQPTICYHALYRTGFRKWGPEIRKRMSDPMLTYHPFPQTYFGTENICQYFNSFFFLFKISSRVSISCLSSKRAGREKKKKKDFPSWLRGKEPG